MPPPSSYLSRPRLTFPALCRHQNLRLASFTQHHNDQFDLKLSAAENFEAMFPKADTQELRSLLGRYNRPPIVCRPADDEPAVSEACVWKAISAVVVLTVGGRVRVCQVWPVGR